jgi:hypothetical protein
MYGVELMKIIIATLAQSLISNSQSTSVVGLLILWRVIMGIRIGSGCLLSFIITLELITLEYIKSSTSTLELITLELITLELITLELITLELITLEYIKSSTSVLLLLKILRFATRHHDRWGQCLQCRRSAN